MDALWEEFRLPIWVTEFDWNAHNDLPMGDHTIHAEQLSKFYRLMFSHEVTISRFGSSCTCTSSRRCRGSSCGT